MSRPYAEVIGDPIAHSKSPAIHNFWLGKLGIDAEYKALRVRPGELAGYFAEKRTDLLVLDGNDVSRPALATVRLPFAVPMAFHGSWMARSG